MAGAAPVTEQPRLDAVPQFARGVRLREDIARGEWVLLAPERILKPDAVALAILRRLDGRASIAEIAADLARSYAAPQEQIEADVSTFLAGLTGKGFVEFAP